MGWVDDETMMRRWDDEHTTQQLTVAENGVTSAPSIMGHTVCMKLLIYIHKTTQIEFYDGMVVGWDDRVSCGVVVDGSHDPRLIFWCQLMSSDAMINQQLKFVDYSDI